MYMSTTIAPIVRKKTAHWGCAGHIFCVTPSSHAPVPIALADKEAFKVFIESAPGAVAFCRLPLHEWDPNEDRVVYSYNQGRKLLFAHISHSFVARVEWLDIHMQGRLGVSGYVKAHMDVGLAIAVDVYQVGNVRR